MSTHGNDAHVGGADRCVHCADGTGTQLAPKAKARPPRQTKSPDDLTDRHNRYLIEIGSIPGGSGDADKG